MLGWVLQPTLALWLEMQTHRATRQERPHAQMPLSSHPRRAYAFQPKERLCICNQAILVVRSNPFWRSWQPGRRHLVWHVEVAVAPAACPPCAPPHAFPMGCSGRRLVSPASMCRRPCCCWQLAAPVVTKVHFPSLRVYRHAHYVYRHARH